MKPLSNRDKLTTSLRSVRSTAPAVAYVVGKPVVVTRASIEFGGKTTYRWEPDLHYGSFPTRLAAKRAYIESLWPDLKGASDAYLARFWIGEPVQAMGRKILKA